MRCTEKGAGLKDKWMRKTTKKMKKACGRAN